MRADAASSLRLLLVSAGGTAAVQAVPLAVQGCGLQPDTQQVPQVRRLAVLRLHLEAVLPACGVLVRVLVLVPVLAHLQTLQAPWHPCSQPSAQAAAGASHSQLCRVSRLGAQCRLQHSAARFSCTPQLHLPTCCVITMRLSTSSSAPPPPPPLSHIAGTPPRTWSRWSWATCSRAAPCRCPRCPRPRHPGPPLLARLGPAAQAVSPAALAARQRAPGWHALCRWCWRTMMSEQHTPQQPVDASI